MQKSSGVRPFYIEGFKYCLSNIIGYTLYMGDELDG